MPRRTAGHGNLIGEQVGADCAIFGLKLRELRARDQLAQLVALIGSHLRGFGIAATALKRQCPIGAHRQRLVETHDPAALVIDDDRGLALVGWPRLAGWLGWLRNCWLY